METMSEKSQKWFEKLKTGNNWKKSTLAENIGVCLPTTNAYLHGTDPSRNMAFKIANNLKLDDAKCEEIFKAMFGKLVEKESENAILMKLLSAVTAAGKATRRERLLFKVERLAKTWEEAESAAVRTA